MIGTEVYFGGPDQPARPLRDLLEARVDAVPAGGAIDWLTYYFRDERLAQALVRAHERGVAVTIGIEASPRIADANDAVIGILRRGIGERLRVVKRWFGAAHLHTKLYAFSGPVPHALVGSFNPSGNEPEDARILDDIGDQDRGHNLLVEIDEPALVDGLVAYVRQVHAGRAAPSPDIEAAGYQAHLFPRSGRNPLDVRIARLGDGAKLRIAASHIRDPRIARELAEAAACGAAVEVLTHHTQRRSPESLVDSLRAAGVRTYRYEHPEALPMHAKFMLAQEGDQRWCAFGSYNLTRTSRWLNQELLVFSDRPALWRTLDARWNAITSEPWCRS